MGNNNNKIAWLQQYTVISIVWMFSLPSERVKVKTLISGGHGWPPANETVESELRIRATARCGRREGREILLDGKWMSWSNLGIQWVGSFYTRANAWPLVMERGQVLGRGGEPMGAFLSISYWLWPPQNWLLSPGVETLCWVAWPVIGWFSMGECGSQVISGKCQGTFAPTPLLCLCPSPSSLKRTLCTRFCEILYKMLHRPGVTMQTCEPNYVIPTTVAYPGQLNKSLSQNKNKWIKNKKGREYSSMIEIFT